jgi:hypothetical protein
MLIESLIADKDRLNNGAMLPDDAIPNCV